MRLPAKKIVLLLSMTALLASCNHGVSESKSNQPDSNASAPSSSDNSEVTSSTSQAPLTSVNYNPHECDNHQLVETIKKEATLLEKGTKHYHCDNCGADFDSDYYKMDEFVFDDMSFMYDGQDHKIQIEGLLPYGISVKYENNVRKEIGNQEATAKFVDASNNVILEKKAKINIVENIGLPNIKIVTNDGDDPDWQTREYEDMKVSIDNCDSQYIKTDVLGTIKVRGNSTNQRDVTKRAWRIKLNGKTNFLGLNDGLKEKSWVLLADYFDQSMFRNESSFSMGNDLFNYSGYYSSDFKHVNVYMNGENRGVYLLAEQQQAKKGRIPVNEPDEGVTSPKVGYLVEIDGLVLQGKSDGDYTFKTSGSSKVNGVTIQQKGYVVKTDIFGDQQGPFIEKYVKNLQKVLISACNKEGLKVLDSNGDIIDSPYESQYETLNSIFDLDSFFRMYVLQEFAKNYDCGWGSFYLFIDFSKDSIHPRFPTGGPWDFDLGLGNKKSDGHPKPDGDYINNQAKNGMTEFNPWLFLLSQTDFFAEQFERYYNAFANSGIAEQAIHDINYETSAFATDFANEYTRWGGDSGRTSMGTRTSYANHQEAVDYLTDWLAKRKTYLDGKYVK